MIRPFMTALAFLALCACDPSRGSDTQPTARIEPAPESAPAASAFPMPSHPDTTSDINTADIGKRLEIIASDTFEGRAPGTEAGEASAQWIADEMARIGLSPGANGAWFQPVGMVAQTVDLDRSHLKFSLNGADVTPEPGKDAVFWSKRQIDAPIAFTDSDMVFVGYGIVAPEYDWNDYAGIDVAGKTVVMLINDPGFATLDPRLFNGKAMTYYGRWTYKFEEAARQGASAAIIIHDTLPAAYGWNVVTGSWSGEQADLKRDDAGMDRVAMEAWITGDLAATLFSAAGLDLATMKDAAFKQGFTPTPLTGLSASGVINQSLRASSSRNVAGLVRGAARPDEYVVYVAHWDHLGKKVNFATDDAIHNGAVDNASGSSLLLEIAEKFAAGPPPERSVLFLSVTLEESGLLGSEYFASHPFVPLNSIVAGVNIDGMLPMGPAHDMIVVGYGASELEDSLADILNKQDRVIRPDPQPENGYFYRSDHVSFAKKGVPMLFADGGIDLVNGGVKAGLAAAADYNLKRYHKPADEYSPDWDLTGFEEDATVFYTLGHALANSSDWPNWYEGHEFREIRDKSIR